ncbi:MAG: cysteine peptidase family C39 domain-containing protein [Bacilli bacterium]|nr:cysteine peptidase family C39 domain-containing protein [Bacilli bacterium]
MKQIKKYYFTKQYDIKNCGAACLSMIIKYYRGYIGLEKLNQLTKTDKNGTSAYNIIEAAKKLGFQADGIKTSFENLNKIAIPFIAYIVIDDVYKHFVVVYEIDYKKKIVVIADPAKKIIKMRFEEFEKIFKNVVLTFIPLHKMPIYKEENYMKNMILKILLDNNKKIIILSLISILVTLLSIMNSFYLKIIIDENDKTINFLIILFVAFLNLSIMKNVIDFIKNKIIIKINKNIDLTLTNDVFNKIVSLPYNYYRNKTTGDIITRFNDLIKIKEMMSKICAVFLIDFLLSLFSLIALFVINKLLFLITIIISLIYILIIVIFKKIILFKIEEVKNVETNINSYLIETISGFETIKGLSIEKNRKTTFFKMYNNFSNENYKLNYLYYKENLFKNFIYDINLIIIIFLGTLFVKNQMMSVGNLVLFVSLINIFLYFVKDIIESDHLIKEAILSINRINEIVYENNTSKKRKINKVNSIEIKNLTYYHNEKQLILKDINLKISKNDKILLIGGSGSGKSTLLKIIKGYYNIKNSVFINDIDINKLDISKISYLSQNEILFTDTIYNNIVLNDNVSQVDFEKICDICCVDEILNKNILGCNTLIEENGFNISGGEKQRIVLARTLLKKSDVILIDEGFSQIDVSTERKILKSIFKNYNNKIIIIVSHRIDNMDLYNKVIKLNNKRIENEIIKTK